MLNFRKMYCFFILLFFLANSIESFSQQILWTTEKTDSIEAKYVPIETVVKEALIFYKQYDYYFDRAGYSKENFIRQNNRIMDDWSWISKINKPTALAIRGNTGRGSVIMVLYISDKNINVVLFSNDMLADKNAQRTSDYEKDKFEEWFKTLLN